MAARLIVLDANLPPALGGELRARGREAATVAELELEGLDDAELLVVVAALDAVLITPYSLAARGAPVAVVTPRGPAARRDVVHRHAGAIAAQRAAIRRYA